MDWFVWSAGCNLICLCFHQMLRFCRLDGGSPPFQNSERLCDGYGARPSIHCNSCFSRIEQRFRNDSDTLSLSLAHTHTHTHTHTLFVIPTVNVCLERDRAEAHENHSDGGEFESPAGEGPGTMFSGGPDHPPTEYDFDTPPTECVFETPPSTY